jgi:hypothetical protein
MTDSYREDHYPYARRDVVDDIIIEEDFQDINDQDDYFHRYISNLESSGK